MPIAVVLVLPPLPALLTKLSVKMAHPIAPVVVDRATAKFLDINKAYPGVSQVSPRAVCASLVSARMRSTVDAGVG